MIFHDPAGHIILKAEPLKIFHRRWRKTEVNVAAKPELTVRGWLAQYDASARSHSLKTLKPCLDKCSANAMTLLVIQNRNRSKTKPARRFPTYGNRRKRYVAHDFTPPLRNQRYRQSICCAQRFDDGSF